MFATHPEFTPSDKIKHWIKPEEGTSPCGGKALIAAAQALAFIEGGRIVRADHVDKLLRPVIRHRVILTFDAQEDGVTGDQVIEEVIEHVKPVVAR